MHRVILDTDPGVDDAMAIAYALCHPEIELLALTTVFGNVDVDIATRNARYLLDQFGARDVAVVEGVGAPLEQARLPPADFVHGRDGLGNTYPADAVALDDSARHSQTVDQSAAEYIIEQTRRYPGEIDIVAVGPLSNIATALRLDPELPGRVRELVVMGGALREPGNVSPVAEANYFNDPHAADEVSRVDWPLSVVGLDVTHRILIGDSVLARLRDEAGQTGKLLWNTSRFYVNFYSRQGAAAGSVAAGAEPSCAMHDAAAVVRLVNPSAFVTETGPTRVVVDGIAAGQMIQSPATRAEHAEPWQSLPDTAVCVEVDGSQVLDQFVDTLIERHRR